MELLNPIPESKCSFVFGYTTRRHLLLDLDDTTLEKAEKLAKFIMEGWPKVGDCLIVESSVKPLRSSWAYFPRQKPLWLTEGSNYHLIFSNYVGLNYCYKIIRILAEYDVLNHDYMEIRSFRGDMTLRVSHVVSSEGVKEPPKPVSYISNLKNKVVEDGINQYLRCLEVGFYFFLTDFYAENKTNDSSNGSNDYTKILTVHTTEERSRFDG